MKGITEERYVEAFRCGVRSFFVLEITNMWRPKFIQESRALALYDNLYPSRIIVGTDMGDE